MALQAVEVLVGGVLLEQALGEGQGGEDLDLFMARVLIDAHVVRGSAYPEQTAEEIREIAGRFDAWFERRLGASATDLVVYLWAIGWTQEEKINAWLDAVQVESELAAGTPDQSTARGAKARRHARRQARRLRASVAMATVARDASMQIPVSRTDCRFADGRTPTEATWNALLTSVGLTPDLLVDRKDALFVRTRPAFVFSGDRVLIGDLSNTLDCLWDTLDQHARFDARLWDRFQDVRAIWLEDKAFNCLTRIFGPDAVYRNLYYPDPDHPDGGAETELDLAVRWGPFLLFVEAKAKQYRLKGQLGDVGRLRADLKANIEDAFTQALRARRYLLESDETAFREREGNRILTVCRRDVERGLS